MLLLMAFATFASAVAEIPSQILKSNARMRLPNREEVLTIHLPAICLSASDLN